MSIAVKLGKAVLRAAAGKAGEEIGQELGKVVGEDLARAYRRWRKLPSQTPEQPAKEAKTGEP